MQGNNKVLQALGIPYSALLSIIFGMMILSFPLGVYVVFNSDIGGEITHEFPLEHVASFFIFFESFPFQIDLGDAFIFIWSIFVIFFAIGIFGPKSNFIKTLMPLLSSGNDISSNYIASMLKWFAILILISAIINFAQEGIDIKITPPDFDNDLIQFFHASMAPFIEEIGFRIVLIGIPLFVMFSRQSSRKNFFQSLWHPFDNLHVYDQKRVLALIVIVGVAFGLAHIVLGEPWSNGKFAQATAGGIILGWVYYRYGFLTAILLHWATNYFILSYVYFIAYLNDISPQEAFSHSFLGTMELIFLISGVISLAFLLVSYFSSRKKPNLEI